MGQPLLVLLFLLLLFSCTQEKGKEVYKGFSALNPDVSKAFLSNQITENDSLNYFTFPYLYLGGGVAIGDINNDGLSGIYFTGNQVPNRLYLNKGDFTFEEVTKDLGFQEKTGWWYSLDAHDLDSDGDTDYIAGNLGLNYTYKAPESSPFEVYANDFDANSSLDIVLSYEKKGKLRPVRGRECSSEQVPALASRFETFEAIAQADLQELYGPGMLASSLHLQANTFASYCG